MNERRPTMWIALMACSLLGLDGPTYSDYEPFRVKRRADYMYRSSYRWPRGSVGSRLVPGTYWTGDGVPATTVTRQMRRAAARKESR